MRSLRVPLIVLLLFAMGSVSADDLGYVDRLLRENIDRVVALLRDREIDLKERNDRIIEIVNPLFDFHLMAQLSLGKRYWPGLNQGQRREFTDLFVRRIQDSYLEKMGLYTDEEVKYAFPKKVKTKIHMSTRLISNDNKISILYKLYQAKKGWKIYDLEIQGVSLIQTYRTQFDSVLRDGTFNELIAQLGDPERFTIVTGKE